MRQGEGAWPNPPPPIPIYTPLTITHKLRIAKIGKLFFLFDSSQCASLMKMGATEGWGVGGGLHILTWDIYNTIFYTIHFFYLKSSESKHVLKKIDLFEELLVLDSSFQGGGPFRRRRFGAGQVGAVPFRCRTFQHRFLIFFFFEL